MAKAGKPVKIGGITITPKWDWGKDFERHVRADMRRVYGPSIIYAPQDALTIERHSTFAKRKSAHQETAYRQWLRDQGKDPDAVINEHRCRADRPILEAESEGVSTLHHWR